MKIKEKWLKMLPMKLIKFQLEELDQQLELDLHLW